MLPKDITTITPGLALGIYRIYGNQFKKEGAGLCKILIYIFNATFSVESVGIVT